MVGAGAKTLYAVVERLGGRVNGDHAVALHLVGGTWKPDRSGAVQVRILGPQHSAAAQPQVAAEISAKKPLVERRSGSTARNCS